MSAPCVGSPNYDRRQREHEKQERERQTKYKPKPPPTPAQVAKEKAEEAKQKVIQVAKALGQILMDEIGITDALNCFTQGDLGACAETALNVAMSFIGGVAGKPLKKIWPTDEMEEGCRPRQPDPKTRRRPRQRRQNLDS